MQIPPEISAPLFRKRKIGLSIHSPRCPGAENDDDIIHLASIAHASLLQHLVTNRERIRHYLQVSSTVQKWNPFVELAGEQRDWTGWVQVIPRPASSGGQDLVSDNAVSPWISEGNTPRRAICHERMCFTSSRWDRQRQPRQQQMLVILCRATGRQHSYIFKPAGARIFSRHVEDTDF